MCPGSSDPFYKVTYKIKWVTTSWTHSTFVLQGTDQIFVGSATLTSELFLRTLLVPE